MISVDGNGVLKIIASDCGRKFYQLTGRVISDQGHLEINLSGRGGPKAHRG